jgi:uncharacterized protein (DUF2141 family)
MKRYIGAFFLFLSLFGAASAIFAEEKAGTLKLVITGFKSDTGKAMVALCDSKANYDGPQSFRSVKAEIVNGKVELSFDSLAYGEYAVKVYHDENENGRLDTKAFGIPKEAYGFSNNVKNKFGPTKYEAAKFLFATDGQEIGILM